MDSTARELLGDFRELEQRFHHLDREVRQRVAAWDGGRGELLDHILGERDAIASSDEGTSFRAFWDFLMSPDRQEEFTDKLKRVFELPAVRMDAPNRGPLDYYVLPSLDVTSACLRIKEDNGIFLDGYRFDSLDYVFVMAQTVRSGVAA